MSEPMSLNHLAPMGPTATAEVEGSKFLTFVLGREVLAVAIGAIKEVIQVSALTFVPLMPGAIRGVINLRGSVVPVVDLSVRFGRQPTEIHRRTSIVILELNQGDKMSLLGVLVDQVREVLEIAQDEMESAPAFGNGFPPQFVQSVGKIAGKFVMVIDVDHALSVSELAV